MSPGSAAAANLVPSAEEARLVQFCAVLVA